MDFYHKLSEAAGADHILKDEPMSAHTTFPDRRTGRLFCCA